MCARACPVCVLYVQFHACVDAFISVCVCVCARCVRCVCVFARARVYRLNIISAAYMFDINQG